MKVLFVCNNVFITGNGISTSARVTVQNLRKAGIDVRLLSAENPNYEGPEPEYILKKFHFPVFQPIIDANSYCFAVYDKEVVREAVEWADVIHIEEAMPLEIKVIQEAERQGKALVGTFHLMTQNIFYNVGLGRWKAGNDILMYIWKKKVFDHLSHMQCPTKLIKSLAESWHFKPELHVISNGIAAPEPVGLKPTQTDPYLVLCIGRMSSEKRQQTLIKAMRYSRHASEIQLHFAGKGRRLNKCRRMCIRLYKEGILKYPAKFGFYGSSKLKELAQRAYLYIHCAVVEVEGLSCAEAIREGAIPIINDAKLSATKEFALCPESIFENSDPKALAARIDWWIEHPEEHEKMRKAYSESACKIDISYTIKDLIAMYQKALEPSSADNVRTDS